MKKIYIIIGILIGFCACTKNFSNINKSTYGIGNDRLLTIPIGGAQIQDLANYVGPSQENSWQMVMDLPAVNSGFTAATGFIADYNTYTPRTSWNSYPYEDSYSHLYSNYNLIKSQTQANYNQFAFCLVSIMRVAISHRLVDMYGPLPYSKINGISIEVPYDSEKDIYLSMMQELKDASIALDKMPEVLTSYKNYDLIYGGQTRAWARYARSLMLRLAIHCGKVLPSEAKSFAEFAYQNGLIMNNSQNCIMPCNDNPINKDAANWGDSRPSADIVEYLKAFKDPRLNKYFLPAKSGRDNEVFGLRSGADFNVKTSSLNEYSLPNLTQESPMVWFSAAEVAFLRAEGVLNGWNMGDNAKNLYEQGIRLSCEQWNADLGDYLSSTTKRGAFIDKLHPSLNNSNFSSNICVNWEEAKGNKEKELSKIITQKWISLYPYATIEAWTEWRRTGYPNLMPILNNTSSNLVQNIIQVNGKDVGGFRRLVFGDKDRKNNANNVTKAVELLGGPDTHGTNLWWAK